VVTPTRTGSSDRSVGGVPGSNGAGKVHAPAVTPPKRRVRLPELAVGLLVTVMFSLGAVLWHLSATSKVPALAVAAPIERGEVIEAANLRVTYIGSDDPLARMTSSESAAVVGRVALVDLEPGTLITRSVVADAAALKAGDGVVGLALEPGQYPALGLAPGDRVNVVRSGESSPGPAEARESRVIARNATVFAVEELTSDRKLVAVLASESDAEVVASAAGAGDLRLVLVAP